MPPISVKLPKQWNLGYEEARQQTEAPQASIRNILLNDEVCSFGHLTPQKSNSLSG